MSEQQTQIDLNPFCDPDSSSSRYAFGEPWVSDGWRYATDGRVLIRVPATGEPDSPPREDGRRRPGNLSKILPPVDGDWKPWPVVESCDQCAGEQKICCSACFGSGTCDGCKCKNEHECGRCDGSGNMDCDKCRDKGSFAPLFGKAELCRHYAWIISNLPRAMYLPQQERDKPLRFKFDGGEGAVMGMRD